MGERTYQAGTLVLDLTDPVPLYTVLHGLAVVFAPQIRTTEDNYGHPMLVVRRNSVLLPAALLEENPVSMGTVYALGELVLYHHDRELTPPERVEALRRWHDDLFESQTIFGRQAIHRVAWLFALLSRENGGEIPPLSHRLMARTLGLNRETFVRQVHQLAELGFLDRTEGRRGPIQVEDPARLYQFALYGDLEDEPVRSPRS